MAQIGGSSDLERDVALARDEHRRLLEALDALLAAERLDVAAPSGLPDWTVGHVLAHLINSGDGHSAIFDAAADGQVVVQYPGGMEGRAADIEAGSVLAARTQVELLRSSIDRLQACWADSEWQGTGIVPMGEVEVTDLVLFRIREVAVHHVDLNIGSTFADLPPHYVRLELRRMGMLWKARQPMGMTSLPAEALTATPNDRLAWLMGRGAIDGLAVAAIF